MKKCKIRISKDHYNLISQHLFPGDGDEHGAVLLAGQHYVDGQLIGASKATPSFLLTSLDIKMGYMSE